MSNPASSLLALLAGVGLALPACGGGDGDSGSIAPGTGSGSGSAAESEAESEAEAEHVPPAANPLGEAVTFSLEPFAVQPGRERQVCKIVNVPAGAPLDVVRIHSEMVGTSHHFNLYKVHDDTQPPSGAEGRVHDCSPASDQLDGEAAYLFGSATPERTLDTPGGVAFRLAPGQRLILEQHVLNFTKDVLDGGVTLELVAAGEGAEIAHHADIAWFASWSITLPPGVETSLTRRCAFPFDVEVVGLMSHTHGLGSHFSIERVPPNGSPEHVYDSDDWAHPPYQEYSPPLAIAAGGGFEWTCTWNNSTARYVTAGQESTDEMCIAFALFYPTGSLAAPSQVQCNVF